MFQNRHKILFAGAILAIAGISISWAVTVPGPSVTGNGTLSVTNSDGRQVRRQFSINARKLPDGKASGSAILHNPSFTVDNGESYMLQIDISCMNVLGNTVVFGGTTKRTSDPNLTEAVFFSVQANGETEGGKISEAFFWDDPTTTGNPRACLNHNPGNFPMVNIEAGNISVR